MRTRVFGKRFQLGGMRQSIQRLNREIRTIRRVVIDPQFRSIGLAWRMVHHTLPVVGVRYVDASAAMGSVNPFFVKAGMRHYPPSPTPANERVLAAFRATGFDTEMITSVPRLERHVASLDAEVGEWLLGEMRKFNKRFQQIGRPPESWSLNRVLQRIASTAATLPDYFVWERETDGEDAK